ncbi:MAG: trypsin-like peptidase domain-containing protein [Ruminococcus flavefaciens]|nr:trypsin-like peptidase domain-containing protein [Ruminococcus flavefaciens]MCM1229648.1 trypsin-like peptidase domain-containing protein [Ruminococcus flavefaciens]
MSDFYNNDENNYNDFSEYKSEETPPKKPKKHTFLKVMAFLVCMGIAGAGSVQIYKFMDNSKFDISEDSSGEESTPVNNTGDSDDDSADDGSGNSQSVPEPQNLPGLFDIASRTDSKYLPDIVDEIMPSVVGISSTFEITRQYSSWGWGFQQPQTSTEEAVATGTGIVMTEDGYIITNAHVVYDSSEYNAGEAKDVSVLFSDKKEYDAKIIAYDIETDLAVLKIDETGFTPATFGDSSDLRVGELVVAVGNPLGFELFGSVTSGIVSALNREISINEKNMTLIQTDAAINQGNSGGPLLNSCGQVIGINSAKMSSSYGSSATVEGLGFAIPINDAKVIIDDLINNGHVTGRPQIGISAVNIDETYSSYLGLPMGIYVRDIAEGSAAEMAGIQVGDVIIGINDEAVTNMDELNGIKNQFKAGDTVTLKIYRNGEDIDIQLVLHDANAEVSVQEN